MGDPELGPELDSSEAELLRHQETCPLLLAFGAVDTEQGRPRGTWERQPWCQGNTGAHEGLMWPILPGPLWLEQPVL